MAYNAPLFTPSPPEVCHCEACQKPLKNYRYTCECQGGECWKCDSCESHCLCPDGFESYNDAIHRFRAEKRRHDAKAMRRLQSN